MQAFLNSLRRAIRRVCGEISISYRPPGWTATAWEALRADWKERPKAWGSAGISLLILISGVILTNGWWEAHQPHPKQLVGIRQLTAKITSPDITPILDGKPTPKPLEIEFSGSIAPVDLVDKPNPGGVILSPETKGEWRWVSDKRLVFRPEMDWPAGTDFELALTFPLPPDVELPETRWKFATKPLIATSHETEFYTDPVHPEIHQAVTGLRFNYPVTKGEVAAHLSLQVLGGTALFPTQTTSTFKVTEGEHHREFWVRSAPISIPAKEDFVTFALAPGIASTIGGKPSAVPFATKIRVPDIESGFNVASGSATIVRNAEGDPEQVIFLETKGYVKPDELASHVEVWLLPRDRPTSAVEGYYSGYHWPHTGEVTPKILAISRKIPLQPVEAGNAEGAPVATTHAFKISPPGVGRLYIRVAAGVEALGGFRLGRDFATILDVPPLPREIELLGEGGLMALNGEHKLGLKYRGLNHLRITLARVPFSQINHLAELTNGDFQSPYWETYGVNEENIARIHREVREVPLPNAWQANYNSFDFSEALARQDSNDPDGSRGLFFVTVEGVRPSSGGSNDSDPAMANWEATGESARRFVLVTDLGLVLKRNATDARDVFVQSIANGEPADGVSVMVLAKNGDFLHETVTDAQGHAVLPNLENLHREKKPVCVIARKGNDVAFLPFQRPDRLLDFSRFDTGGVRASEAATLDGFLFTERGIYRPGDAIHFGALVKQRDWQGALTGLPVRLAVENSKGETVSSQELSLAADGFAEVTAATAEDAPTGPYSATLYRRHGSSWDYLASTTFRVEEFQPDRMKVSLRFNTPEGAGWIQPKNVEATLSVQNLFGMAAENRRVKAKLILDPGEFAFEKYPELTFHNGLRKSGEEGSGAGQEVDLGEQVTDAKGEARFKLDLERFTGGVFRMELFAEAFEADGGRSVRTAESLLIAPLPYVVGWKADGDLGYIGMDTPRHILLRAIDPSLQPHAAPKLKQRMVEIRHASVLTKQQSGNFAYVSTVREQTVSEGSVDLGIEGITADLATGKPGEFRYELIAADGTIVCAVPYSVVGKGDAGRSMERDAELELKLSRTSANGGETLEFSLRAPFTGAGLATIERDGVLSWQWIKQTTPDAVHRIAVPEGIEGTVYLNVAFVRALDSPDRLVVSLDAPELVRPGKPLKIGYTSPQPSRIVIYAVDEGIHQVTGYELPDPLAHFTQKRALEVQTSQLLDLILPEFSILSKQKAYGGDGDGAVRLHLNPFKRRREAPVVFWSGLIPCGPERQEVTFPVPDFFAGGLNLMAIAVNEGTIGRAEAHCTVRGPFVLTPNAPFFAAPGDEFTASVTVANQLEGPGAPDQLALQAKASAHLELLTPAQIQVAVAPGKEATARFRVKVKDDLGGAELRFQVDGAGETVTRDATLSVRPAAPYMTHLQSGYFRLGHQDVPVARELYPQFRKANASLSALPMGLARGLESYLREYPYGCSEQITSRAISRLILAKEADFGFDPAESAEQLSFAFALLRTRQNGNGGFGYWSSACDPRPDFLSVYVTTFLTEARDAGSNVPAGLLEGAQSRMKEIARAETESLDDAKIQAAAIYLLTRHGETTTNFVLNLRDTLEKQYQDQWRGTLAAAYLAGSYSLLKQEGEARTLIDAYRSRAGKKPALSPWNGEWWNDPQVANAAGFSLICRHFPEIASRFGYEDLAVITEPVVQRRFNTISSAMTILALKAYSQLAAKSDLRLSITALDRAQGATPKTLVPPASGLLHAPFNPETGTLRFQLDQGKGDLGAFYQVVEAGFDKGAPDKTIADGFEVFRDLLDAKGKPVQRLKTGESVTVTLRLRNISPYDQLNVALLDLLPGSFEVEQGTLSPGPGTVPGADFVEVREDRNVFFTSVRKGQMQTFTYRIKPIAAGTFRIPPVYAESMYDPSFKARSGGGSIVVE
jgi:alpha-2-macroglobulin